MNDVTLPNGWAIATLGDVTDETVDRCGPAGSEFIYVDISSIDREKKFISDAKVIESASAPSRAKQVLQGGDVLISMTRPNLNAIAMVTTEFHGSIGSTGFHVLRSKWVEPKFLFYLVHAREFIEKMCLCVQGALYPAVRPNDIASFSFSLPSRAEQHRIVAKIEELFSELDKGIENLKTARAQLKVYRQALLKHAFEGKLTAQWRAENQDKLETADALLQRIQQERAQRYQQQLTDWEAAGKPGSKPKAPKSLPPLTAEELAELPELPEGWGWLRVQELADKVTDGEHITPRRTAAGYYLLSARNIQNGYLDLSNVDYVPQDEFERIRKRCNPEEGDILISCSGSIGRICRVPKDLDFVMVRSVAVVKLQDSIESSKFYEYLFQSPLLQRQIEKGKKATAQANLFLDPINNLKILVCSKEEQMMIIGEMEARLSEVDQLELTLSTSLQQAEALRQSILKKAFSGQLVPQDPHDEPASRLLARIKAERAKLPPSSGRSRSNKGVSEMEGVPT